MIDTLACSSRASGRMRVDRRPRIGPKWPRHAYRCQTTALPNEKVSGYTTSRRGVDAATIDLRHRAENSITVRHRC